MERCIPSQVLLIVYKYLSRWLYHPNLSPESASARLPHVLPRIAYLNLVIVNVGFGLILHGLSLEENLDALADDLESQE
jgi:hypothetical protein